jgi:hypothetical protein
MRKSTTLVAILFSVISLSFGNHFTEESIERFVDLLEGQGFIVQEGSLYLFNPADIFGNFITPSCFCNNTDSPYAVYLIPEGPGQEAPNKYPWTYKLAENEAIVYLGWTLPAMVYFSCQTMLAGRFFDGDFKRIYANLGDTINSSSSWTRCSLMKTTLPVNGPPSSAEKNGSLRCSLLEPDPGSSPG